MEDIIYVMNNYVDEKILFPLVFSISNSRSVRFIIEKRYYILENKIIIKMFIYLVIKLLGSYGCVTGVM